MGGGRVGATSDRPPTPGRRDAWRLKRSIDLFSASDGRLYLMRAGTGEDLVVDEPTAFERALLELLAEGFRSREELCDTLQGRGVASDAVDRCMVQLDEFGIVERAPIESPLAPVHRERYDRQLIYWADLAPRGVSAEHLQKRLAEATVVVLGCGGLGSWAASALACAGIGRLVLIDHDRIELSNLNRQLLFSESDIGRTKVEAAADALGRHNSDVVVVPVPRLVTGPGDLADLLDDVDLLIATADWPPYELPRWVNRACLDAVVPHLSAGQYPPLIRVGPMVIPGCSACFQCAELQARRSHPLFEEFAGRVPHSSTAATLGAASGVAGSLLAMEALHLLTGAAEPATIDTAVVIDLRMLLLSRERVERDPSCPACGTDPESPA